MKHIQLLLFLVLVLGLPFYLSQPDIKNKPDTTEPEIFSMSNKISKTIKDLPPCITTNEEVIIGGSINTHTIGLLSWTNTLTKQYGKIPATNNWLIPITLGIGTNTIYVTGTNLLNESSTGFALVIQRIPFSEFKIETIRVSP